MKMKLICSLLFLCAVGYRANAGALVEKSMYVPQTIAVGTGKTQAEARADAVSSVPKLTASRHYRLDPNNSPVLQCLNGEAPDMKTESCHASSWQMTIPLVLIER